MKQTSWASKRAGEPPGVVAGLTVHVEAGGGVIDGTRGRGVVVTSVAADAGNGGAREGHVAQIAVALAAGDHGVFAAERKARSPVGVGAEQRALPALLVVTPLAVQAQLASVAISEHKARVAATAS
jgi:hypothetical protein